MHDVIRNGNVLSNFRIDLDAAKRKKRSATNSEELTIAERDLRYVIYHYIYMHACIDTHLYACIDAHLYAYTAAVLMHTYIYIYVYV